MNRAGYVHEFEFVFHCHHDLRDGLSGTLSDDCSSQDRAVRLRENLNEAISVIFANGAVDLAQRPAADLQFIAVVRSSFLFARSYVSDLGICERDSRHEICQTRIAAGKQRVAHGLEGLPAGIVRELVAT